MWGANDVPSDTWLEYSASRRRRRLATGRRLTDAPPPAPPQMPGTIIGFTTPPLLRSAYNIGDAMGSAAATQAVLEFSAASSPNYFSRTDLTAFQEKVAELEGRNLTTNPIPSEDEYEIEEFIVATSYGGNFGAEAEAFNES